MLPILTKGLFMKIADVCKNYFNGCQEISNFKNNDTKVNALAFLKILSYFTVIIPLIFTFVYAAASLYGRVSTTDRLSHQDQNIDHLAKKTLNLDEIDLSKITPIEDTLPHSNIIQ